MAINVYDTANKLEGEIRQTPEFVELSAAYDAMMADSAAYDLFKEFQELQMNLQQKSMNAEDISEDEMKSLQELAGKVGEIALIQTLMAAEQKMSLLVNDINRIVMKPVQELYLK